MPGRRHIPLLLLPVLLLSVAVLATWTLRAWPALAALFAACVLCAYAAWVAWEGTISVRDARVEDIRPDRGTNEIYALAQGTTVLTSLLWSAAPTSLAIAFGGVLTLAAGVALRVWAVRSLGPRYSHRVRPPDGLVTSGPYRFLRHPAYAGMLSIHIGLALCFSSIAGAASVLCVLLPSILWRIGVEERALASLPGYRDFSRHRRRLIPYVW